MLSQNLYREHDNIQANTCLKVQKTHATDFAIPLAVDIPDNLSIYSKTTEAFCLVAGNANKINQIRQNNHLNAYIVGVSCPI